VKKRNPRRKPKTDKNKTERVLKQAPSAIEREIQIVQRAVDLGVEHHSAGDLDQAEIIYKRILDVHPNQPIALNLLGLIAHQRGQHERAVELIAKALTVNPDYAEAHFNLGNALHKQGALDEAICSYQKALAITPEFVDAHIGLSDVYEKQGNLDEAVSCLRRAISVNPMSSVAYNNIGGLLKSRGAFDEAVSSLEKGITLDPDNAVLHYNLGDVLEEQGKWDKAASCFDRAIEINPEFVDAYIGLGIVQQFQGNLDKAATNICKAITIDPNCAKAHHNLGKVLEEKGELEEALSEYRFALDLDSELYSSQVNLGLLQLLMQDFAAGWVNYEARFLIKDGVDHRKFEKPAWQGEELADRGLALLSEQGIGDQILYASLFKDLPSCKKLIVECERRLVPLFERSFSDIDFIGARRKRDAALSGDNVDFQASMGSIFPHVRPKPTTASEPQACLKSDDALTQKLSERYRKIAAGRPVVGISWSSANKAVSTKKSLPLEMWVPILTASPCFFVSLQYGDVTEELADFKKTHGIDIFHDPEIDSLENLDDFAAQLSAMDLVISISNASVHMAGALGVETWLMLSHIPPLWYWQLSGEKSLWYPRVDIFRQPSQGDWDSVIHTVARQLESYPKE
jgi:tetratricopeptide (TPR) repeat protein